MRINQYNHDFLGQTVRNLHVSSHSCFYYLHRYGRLLSSDRNFPQRCVDVEVDHEKNDCYSSILSTKVGERLTMPRSDKAPENANRNDILP